MRDEVSRENNSQLTRLSSASVSHGFIHSHLLTKNEKKMVENTQEYLHRSATTSVTPFTMPTPTHGCLNQQLKDVVGVQ